MILQCVTRQSLAQFSLSGLLLGDRPAVHIAHVRHSLVISLLEFKTRDLLAHCRISGASARSSSFGIGI